MIQFCLCYAESFKYQKHFTISFLIGLTWSQCDDSFTLHALPTTHSTNLYETTSSAGIYHTDIENYDCHGGGTSGIEEMTGGDDFDYAMDCGDFAF